MASPTLDLAPSIHVSGTGVPVVTGNEVSVVTVSLQEGSTPVQSPRLGPVLDLKNWDLES